MDAILFDEAFEEEEEEESSGSWATAEGSDGEIAGGGEEASTSAGGREEETLRSREKGMHGCMHYRRRCKLVAPCCGEAFW